MNKQIMVQIEHVSKEYRLGAIGGTTLRDDLARLSAKILKKEDPTLKIGQNNQRYGEKFLALDDISFKVYKGEAVGIIGRNGAGKSTLLKLLSRVTAPSAGIIGLNGMVASMLEVGTGFHPELTGRENIYMNGAILGMTRAEIDTKVEDIIDFSECRQFIDTPVKRYSSGMYVKLAFSVAAHLDSEIMIMDEVLAVGDMAFQKKCLSRMRNAAINEGRTVLYVSHNMSTIRQLCDRCIVLDKGKVVFSGEVETAIEVYMNSLGKMQSNYEYTEEYRAGQKKGDGRINILSLILRDGLMPVCSYGGQLDFDIVCHSTTVLKNVYFRFEIQYQDETLAGTMLSTQGLSFMKNEDRVIHMIMDTSHLAPGRYKVDIIAYLFNEYGNEQFLDGVYPGIVIEIEDTINESNKLIWLHRYWGHVRLNDIQIKE